MKSIILILVFITLFSCTKKVEMIKKNGISYIKKLETSLSNLSDDEWKVGQEREFSISKGIRFDITIPQLETEDKKNLKAKYGIDSWVFKVSKHKRGSNTTLGYFRYDLSGNTQVSKDVTIHIYYQAASLSQRQRRQKCPEMHHNKKVKGMFFTENRNLPINIFVNKGKKVFRKIEQISFSPLIFAAGTDLKASYSVSTALLNSATKRVYTKWMPSLTSVKVEDESEVIIKTCR